MTYNQLRKKQLTEIQSEYMRHYVAEQKYGIEFLRDAIAYFNDRNEQLNNHKTYLELLAEYGRKIRDDHYTYADFEKMEAKNGQQIGC